MPAVQAEHGLDCILMSERDWMTPIATLSRGRASTSWCTCRSLRETGYSGRRTHRGLQSLVGLRVVPLQAFSRTAQGRYLVGKVAIDRGKPHSHGSLSGVPDGGRWRKVTSSRMRSPTAATTLS